MLHTPPYHVVRPLQLHIGSRRTITLLYLMNVVNNKRGGSSSYSSTHLNWHTDHQNFGFQHSRIFLNMFQCNHCQQLFRKRHRAQEPNHRSTFPNPLPFYSIQIHFVSCKSSDATNEKRNFILYRKLSL